MFDLLMRHVLQRRGLAVLLALAGTLALGLPADAVVPAYAQGSDPGDGDHMPGRPAAWDVLDDTANAPPALATAQIAAAATDCLGLPTRRVRYTSDGVLHLEGCGQIFRLSDIQAAGIGPDKLELVDAANKIWFLKVKLKVDEGATLRVSGGASGDANWLRLRSDSASGIWLRADNGNLLFQDTKVTSWDPAIGAPDTDPTVAPSGAGGRSYIATRSVLTKGRPTVAPTACQSAGGSQEPYEGRMTVLNSEIGYLGYDASESYGIVWKVYYKLNPADSFDAPPPSRQLYAMVDVFGSASGSSFHHNYFGSYTFGGYCMDWRGNTFANNLQYGLDPHDDSDYLTISGNTFRDNGDHGLICSIECDHLAITNNQSYGNLIGIMLHRNVTASVIEGNTVANNRQDGIALFDSHDNVVRNNTVTNNSISAIRLSVGSSRNTIENNTLIGLTASEVGSGYVIYTYKGADQPTAGDGLPKQNIFRNNRLTGYKSPLAKIAQATDNLFESNTIVGSTTALMFNFATGNRVRNSKLGKTFQITLDSSSSVSLEDIRGLAWMLSKSGFSTSVGPSGSTLTLDYADAGPILMVTPLDLALKPQYGTVAVQPTAWSAGERSWIETRSAASGTVAHSVGGLTAGACYSVAANHRSIGAFKADSSGHIVFSSSGQNGTVDYAINSAQCSLAAPAPMTTLLLPLIRR